MIVGRFFLPGPEAQMTEMSFTESELIWTSLASDARLSLKLRHYIYEAFILNQLNENPGLSLEELLFYDYVCDHHRLPVDHPKRLQSLLTNVGAFGGDSDWFGGGEARAAVEGLGSELQGYEFGDAAAQLLEEPLPVFLEEFLDREMVSQGLQALSAAPTNGQQSPLQSLGDLASFHHSDGDEDQGPPPLLRVELQPLRPRTRPVLQGHPYSPAPLLTTNTTPIRRGRPGEPFQHLQTGLSIC
jgi:hypothetical protein